MITLFDNYYFRSGLQIQIPLDLFTFVYHTNPNLYHAVQRLRGCKERLDYHPEGNTFDHVRIVIGRAIVTGDKQLLAAALFHDLGKMATYKYGGNRDGVEIHSYPSHEKVSEGFVLANMNYIDEHFGNAEKVYEIVKYHMRIKQYIKGSLLKPQKRAAMENLSTFNALRLFAKMDNMLESFYYKEDINSYLK